MNELGTLASGGGILGIVGLFLLAIVRLMQKNGCQMNSPFLSCDCNEGRAPTVEEINVAST